VITNNRTGFPIYLPIADVPEVEPWLLSPASIASLPASISQILVGRYRVPTSPSPSIYPPGHPIVRQVFVLGAPQRPHERAVHIRSVLGSVFLRDQQPPSFLLALVGVANLTKLTALLPNQPSSTHHHVFLNSGESASYPTFTHITFRFLVLVII